MSFPKKLGWNQDGSPRNRFAGDGILVIFSSWQPLESSSGGSILRRTTIYPKIHRAGEEIDDGTEDVCANVGVIAQVSPDIG